MKKLLKASIVLIIALSISTSTFANSPNISSWAEDYVKEAESIGLMSNSYMWKSTQSLTRRELASLAISFYEQFNDIEYESTLRSPFIDTNFNNAISVYELGIMKGTSENTFEPDRIVTREELALIIYNTLNVCNINLKTYGMNASVFLDETSISPEILEAVKFLNSFSIMAGYDNRFHPKEEVTMEQAAITILKAYRIFGESSFSIGDKQIYIGEDWKDVLNTLGTPDREDKSVYNAQRYIYNSDYDNFIMIGVKNDVVTEIYSNALNFSYNGISNGINMSEVKAITSRDDEKGIARYKKPSSEITVYYDTINENTVDAIYVKSDAMGGRNGNFYNNLLKESLENEVIDIINSARNKKEIPMLAYDKPGHRSAKRYSANLVENGYTEYDTSQGITPFERMRKEGAVFTTAAEIVLKVYGDSFDVYHEILLNTAKRANMLNPSFEKFGVGIDTQKFDVYSVIDIYK